MYISRQSIFHLLQVDSSPALSGRADEMAYTMWQVSAWSSDSCDKRIDLDFSLDPIILTLCGD